MIRECNRDLDTGNRVLILRLLMDNKLHLNLLENEAGSRVN